ncbi:hypothetical protein D3C74_410710 [compost metagenome]
MKILAGWKLKNRKPIILPSNTRHIKAIIMLPIRKDITAMVPMAIPDTPAARPSRPSIKLIALVTPTIHKIVSGMDTQASSEE